MVGLWFSGKEAVKDILLTQEKVVCNFYVSRQLQKNVFILALSFSSWSFEVLGGGGRGHQRKLSLPGLLL